MPDVLTEKGQGYVPGTKKEDIVVQIHGATSKDIENLITNYYWHPCFLSNPFLKR